MKPPKRRTDKELLDYLNSFLEGEDAKPNGFRWHVDKSTGCGFTFTGCGGHKDVRKAISAAMSKGGRK